VLWWLASVAWGGSCTLADIDRALDTLDRALAADFRSVEPATELVERQIKCTKEMVPAMQAARVHRTFAVLAHRTKDPDLAARHLLAAWIAMPIAPKHELMPVASASQEQFKQLQETLLFERPTSPLSSLTYVDGHAALWTIDGLPAILQRPGKKPKFVR